MAFKVYSQVKDIILTTINAKWIHPSLALRLLKANLGPLEDRCEIIEFALRQPLAEKLEPFISGCPRILGISVSIWNHTAALELLGELEKIWEIHDTKPVIILGGPEVSHLPQDSRIFMFADYVIRGEGETAFRALCETIMTERHICQPQFIAAENVDVSEIKSAYRLYTDEDIAGKLIYVEAGRGCPFNCEFCLSAVKGDADTACAVREFPLEPFLAEMDILVQRGVKTFKFLDRTFNINVKRAIRIMEFFLEKIEERKTPLTVHFEMVPSLFPQELRETLTRFPPGTLRLEVGIQTLNPEVAARIGLPGRHGRHSQPSRHSLSSNCEKELEALSFLREKTNAIIHADLIAGLPGENLVSFGKGFDRLWLTLSGTGCLSAAPTVHPAGEHPRVEIQLGILKLLPGAPISRHNEVWQMRYNPLPPYEIEETSAMSAGNIQRIKNFARFWELIVNRGLINHKTKITFDDFLALSDSLFARFGRNWGIDKKALLEAVTDTWKH